MYGAFLFSAGEEGMAEAGGFSLEPDAVVRRHLFLWQEFLDGFSVPVARRGGNVNQKRHQWAIKTVLNAVPVLMFFETPGGIPAGKEKDPQAAAAPALPNGEIQASSESLRAMPGEKHSERNDCTAEIDRQTPGKGSEIEFPIRKRWIWTKTF